jgi:AcrR family transcriptional regulator
VSAASAPTGRAAGAAGRAPGRRERTKQANRAAILAAAREVFAEIGYGAATVRDIIRRTDLAAGTFYNHFPDKEAVFRALDGEAAERGRERVRAGRAGARTYEELVRGGFRAFFRFIAEDPVTFALTHRNAGTFRLMFDLETVGAGVADLRLDLDAAVADGLVAPMDTEYVAAAMVGVGIEVGLRMLQRDPVDPDAAADFAAGLFLSGVPQ